MKFVLFTLFFIPAFTWAQGKQQTFEQREKEFLQKAANVYRLKFTESKLYWLAGKGKEIEEMIYPEKTRYIEIEIPAIETADFGAYAKSYDETLEKLHKEYAEMWCGANPEPVRIVYILTAHYGQLARVANHVTDNYTPLKKS